MAKITRKLAANICRQFFFVINTAASSRCLVENFQLICHSQRVNATLQYKDSDSSRCSKPGVQMFERSDSCSGETLLAPCTRCRERRPKTTTG